MRAYQLTGKGLEGLTPVELRIPQPGPTQLLVRMHAASLNYRDLLVATNRYGQKEPKYPLVPLSDGSGEIVEVGSLVRQFAPGDRVVGNFFQKWSDGPFDKDKSGSALGGGAQNGVLADYVLFEADASVRIPDTLTFAEASTLPCAGLTAWVALVVAGDLKAGEIVLAMGTGGVSLFGLQIAQRMGASVVITSSSDEKLARAQALGADMLVNYTSNPDWDERVLELTGRRGVDHVLEVGGRGTLPASFRATREGGHIALIGLLTGTFPNVNSANENDRSVRISAIYVGSTRQLRDFVEFITATSIKPVVDRVFPFAQARAAYDCLAAQQHFGKIVIGIRD